MAQYIIGWKHLPTWEVPLHFTPHTFITVLIPARNEAENITSCLNSIFEQHYPKSLFEVIVLDDYSTDSTAHIVQSFQYPNLKVLSLSDFLKENETQSYKKKAIEIGIAHAKGSLIVTTDADCVVPENWLALIASFYELKKFKFIAAPVNFYNEKNTLERFQSLDFMGMMGIAGGGIQRRFMRMCNGANLAYEKQVFYEVNGFEGINHLASGDDMLLMQKVAAQYPQSIGYLKNSAATVLTHAKPDWRSFLNQRIRWSTKSSSYRERLVTLILALVFFFCVNLVISLLLLPFTQLQGFYLLMLGLMTKAVMDFIFLYQMSHFFNRTQLMRYFVPSFFLHIIYISVVGFLATTTKKYEWKGRTVQ